MRLSKLMTLAAACFLLVPGLAATAGAEPTMFKEAPAGAPDPDKLAQDVNDRLTDGMVDSRIDVEITLVNANGGKRVRKLDRYQKNFNVTDRKFILVFNSPADVKKTAFLVWDYEDADKDDDRWLYLPSMKQTRRISGASKNDYFMGSDLTYDDLGKRPVKKDAHKITSWAIPAGSWKPYPTRWRTTTTSASSPGSTRNPRSCASATTTTRTAC